MEQIKQKALQRLNELRKIKFSKPTARELHSDKSMLSRVHRQEMQKYEQEVRKQKEKIIADISKIDKHLQSAREYEAYVKNLPMSPKTIKPIPKILKKPNITFESIPIFRKTRLSRYRRGR